MRDKLNIICKKNIKGISIITITIIFTIIFCIQYYLNCLTPLCNDDYGYSFTLYEPLTRVTNISQIMAGLKRHYLYQGGRMFSHFFAQLMLMKGDSYFNIANAFMYCLLVVGVNLNTYISHKKSKTIIYILIEHVLLFLYIPAFGESFLWLDGSVNYLWTNVVMMYALYPYLRLLNSEQINKYRYYFWLPLFFISGATNENTALAHIYIYICIMVCVKKRRGKLPLWSYLGVILSILAYCTLIFAPGNYVRANGSKDYGIFINLIIRFAKTTYYFLDNEFVLIIVVLLLIQIKCLRNKKNSDMKNEGILRRVKSGIQSSPTNFIFVTAILISTYSMIAAPVQPARTFVYPSILLIILLIRLLDENLNCFSKGMRMCLSAVLLGFYLTTMVNAMIDMNKINTQNNRIIQEICESKQNGIKNVVVDKPAIPKTKYALNITLSEDTDFFYNHYYALYYGVESIKATN